MNMNISDTCGSQNKFEKCCKNCKYMKYSPEFWHDHYYIRERNYCSFDSLNEYEVCEDDCCIHFEAINQ